MSAADIPVDPALPQLRSALSTEVFSQVLEKNLLVDYPKNQYRVNKCRIVNIRYKPARYLYVFYELDLRDNRTGRRELQLIGGKVYAKRLSKNFIARKTSAIRATPPHGFTYIHVPELNTLLTGFPNDFRIRNLYQLLDEAELLSIVRTTLKTSVLIPSEDDCDIQTLQVISYRPERYCFVRVSFGLPMTSSQSVRSKSIYARIFHTPETGLHAYQVLTSLWDGIARSPNPPCVAEPLGYDQTSRILFQDEVPGITLSSLTNHPDFLEYIKATAHSLAVVHTTAVSEANSRTPVNELEKLEMIVRTFIRLIPALSKTFTDVMILLEKTLPKQQEERLDFIHGDFSMNQVLIYQSRASIIDFSGVKGDPLNDIASFVIRMEHHVHGSLLHQSTNAFYQQYELTRLGVIDYDRLAWFQAQALVEDAFTALKKLRPQWPDLISRRILRAAKLLDGMGRQ